MWIKQIFSLPYYPHVSELSNHGSLNVCPIHIWQVSLQLGQCWKFPQVCRSKANNFGGGLGIFCWFFYNFMFMTWDLWHEDLKHFYWVSNTELGWGDTCHIWMWFTGSGSYFWKTTFVLDWEIDELGLSNPSMIHQLANLADQMSVNTLRLRQNCHVADYIFKCIFLNENEWILLRTSLKFFSKELP